jgi:serine phosphatase RsbU (regulator of sigma subunit)
VRAHSESPELVHERYVFPEGVPAGEDGRWIVGSGGEQIFHFSQRVRVDGRPVGSVVWGVPQGTLAGVVNSVLLGVGQWTAVALVGGWLLVLVGATWMARPVQRIIDTLRNGKSTGGKPPTLLSEPEEIQQVLAAFQDAAAAVAQTERQLAERDSQRRELEASRHLQRALMPQELPAISGYEFGAACRMARQVGGDYYDVIALDGGPWLIIVADVAGKGLPAGLVMTSFRTATRLLAPSHRSPKSLLAALHRYLVENHESGPFVTACCLVLVPERNQIEISSAGHTPAVIRRAADGSVRRVNPPGRPIGIPLVEDRVFIEGLESEVLTLEPGDRLLLFTDGLADARSGEGEVYGLQRIESCLKVMSSLPPTDFVSEVFRHVDRFSDGADAVDDLTLVVFDRASVPVADGGTPSGGDTTPAEKPDAARPVST